MILPRPSQEQIRQVYENAYRSKRLQPHLAVDNRVRYSAEYRPTVFSEYASSLADLGVERATVRSVLDYGCADGIFLSYCRTHFRPETRLVGTDISEDMLAEARREGFTALNLEALAASGDTFGLITFWDVLEHLPDPLSVLLALKSNLATDGRMLIQTPRFGRLAELVGESWSHLLPVQHLSLATRESLQEIAARAGLRILVQKSFSANAPGPLIPQPFKRAYDTLAKELDFGGVQLALLARS